MDIIKKFNITDFVAYKARNRKITMVTAYDFNMAEIVAESAIDTILVGDSLGMTVHGNPNTLSVSLEDILYHTKVVKKGAPNKFIIADMPFLSYHLDIKTTIQNAGRLIKEGAADAVKLEINDMSMIDHIAALVKAQIPVIAHVGMTPQSVNVFGSFRSRGRDKQQIEHIELLARAAEHAGASAIVIECTIPELAQKLTKNLTIATIGIGSGNDCDGQVLVLNDLLGFSKKRPSFAKQYLDGRNLISTALTKFGNDVAQGKSHDHLTNSSAGGQQQDQPAKALLATEQISEHMDLVC